MRLYLLRKREKTDQLRAIVISLIGDWKVSTEREKEREIGIARLKLNQRN